MERGMRTMNWAQGLFVHKRNISVVKRVEFVSDRISYIIHLKISLSKVGCSHIAPFINIIKTSPDGNTHNQIDHILIDRRRHSSVLDIRSFRAADCDTGPLSGSGKN
jgi:hypothetical protein